MKVGAPSLAVSGCSLAGTWKLLDPSGREELGGAEEFPVSGWGVSPDIPNGATAESFVTFHCG